jgi:hypothetical protein
MHHYCVNTQNAVVIRHCWRVRIRMALTRRMPRMDGHSHRVINDWGPNCAGMGIRSSWARALKAGHQARFAE